MMPVLRFTIDHFLLLPIGGLLALLWANTAPESYFTFAQRWAFLVNEIGMAIVFALMTQDVFEAVLPGGALHTWRRWTVPLLAAVGAIAGAIAVYLAYVSWHYELLLSEGWPVAAVIDLAFAYALVKSIFRRHAAVPFVLVLAICVDVVVIGAVASRGPFFTARAGGTSLILAALTTAYVLRRAQVRTFWPYLLLSGPLAWWALYLDGLHPALALVPIVPFVPHAPRGLDLFEDRPHGAHDSPTHLEHVLKYPAHAVLFVFGLVNAGVMLSAYGTGTWAVAIASLLGKPLGIVLGVGLAVLAGLHLPRGLHWRDVAVIAVATSGGFAFALFAATAVYPLGPALAELKIGAIASGAGVLLALALAWQWRLGIFAQRREQSRRLRAPRHARAPLSGS